MRGTMTDESPTGESQRCSRSDLNASVPSYCFGNLSDEQRDLLEAHVLNCDFCWSEIQRLDSLVSALRADRTLTQRTYAPDIVASAAISGQLDSHFAGHGIHVIVISSLYALLFAETVFLEIAYDYQRFATLALSASPILFLSIFLTTILSLWVDWKLIARSRPTTLLASGGILVLAGLVLYVCLRPFLPDYAITQASFPTETAQSAYMKGVFRYFLPLALIFLLIPFNFIVAMQRQLATGRYTQALGVLEREKHSLPPRGAPFPRFWVLCLFLAAGALYSILSTAHLLENLKPTPFSNLFIHIIQIRWLTYFVAGLQCLAWYYWALSELKRECIAVLSLNRE